MRQRESTLELLQGLPHAPVIGHEVVLALITNEHLFGLGIGLVDAQLIASARSVQGALLWTRDRRLAGIADKLGVRYESGARAGSRNPDR
jgi:predicted nucleic acid-binding protein